MTNLNATTIAQINAAAPMSYEHGLAVAQAWIEANTTTEQQPELAAIDAVIATLDANDPVLSCWQARRAEVAAPQMTTIEQIKAAAIASTKAPRFAVGQINRHEVEALVAEGYRNGGIGKISIRWSVDGKRVAAANLQAAIAA
jgi:hypothetical protein